MTDEEKAAADKAAADADKKKKKKEDEPEKLELTQEELDAQIAKAVAKATKKFETDKAAAEESAKAEAARKSGEFEKLYNSEVARAKAAEDAVKAKDLELKRKDVQLKLRDHLTENHKDYVASAKYVMPLIDFEADTSDEEIDKRIKSASAQFVKDNPRKTAGGAPAHGGDRSIEGDRKKKEEIPMPSYLRRM